MQLVECVPNFSEGRNLTTVDQIVSAIKSVDQVAVLDREADANHNRSVVTFAGPPQAVKLAAFQAIKTASSLIDLTKHQGEHPRIGATDVVPFIPLSEVTMDDCVRLARELGQDVGEKLKIPVYLYEAAATRPERKNLARVRKGQFEGLRDEMGKNPDRKPDFGPNRIHPTAGATVIGARSFLIAYNINLATSEVKIAKAIARTIRESSGGLPCVKALGIELKVRNQKLVPNEEAQVERLRDPDRGVGKIRNQQSAIRQVAQVSMNLTDYQTTSMKTVFDAVQKEAEKLGAKVLESELIGLLPADALKNTTPEELLFANFHPSQIIENRIKDHFSI